MLLDRMVERHYHELNENDLYIWQYIAYHKRECQKMSIHELAKICNMSHTSILRFTKKIGLEGYSELKIRLKMDLEEKSEINEKLMDDIHYEFDDSLKKFKRQDMNNVIEMIHYAKRVFVYATGQSQINFARELRRNFLYVKKVFHIVGYGDEIDTILNNVNEDDLFIIISLSGNNEQAVMLARALTGLHVAKIGICLEGHSLLSQNCEENINFQATAFKIEMCDASYTSCVHFYMLGEILFLKYLQYLETVK